MENPSDWDILRVAFKSGHVIDFTQAFDDEAIKKLKIDFFKFIEQ